MIIHPEDYEDEILEKLYDFFEKRGEIISDETLEELASEIFKTLSE